MDETAIDDALLERIVRAVAAELQRQATPPAYYTPPDIAKLLGIDSSKVIAWINRGELRAVNVAESKDGKRSRWRIPQESLDDFLRLRASPSAPPVVRSQPRFASTRRMLGDGIIPYFYADMAELQYVLKHSAEARKLNREGCFYIDEQGAPQRRHAPYKRGPKAVCIVMRGAPEG
jgi:excisionase family DNA binding protein